MQLVRRLHPFVIAACLVACGGSGGSKPDGGGGGGGGGGMVDAAPMFMDAANTAAQGLGKVCDQMHACPMGLSCVALSMTATHGFCTLPCGTSTSNTMPPANGNTTCTNAQPPPGQGTPACALVGAKTGNSYPWDCAIECGTLNNMNLGGCPGGLVCTNNICQ